MERLNSEDHLLRKLIILLIVILLFIPCISLGQQVLPDGAIVEGDLEVESASGIDINPGSDTDTDLVTIGVTGSPVFGWDETNDAFTISKSIVFQALTATTVPYLDGNKVLTSSSVTPTELGYVSGVTSAIQTQIDSKVTDSFTASRVLESDGSGNAQASSVTSTELGYLSGAGSSICGKDDTCTVTNRTFNADGTGNSITNIENADIKSGAAIDATKIHDGSVTNTEFSYLDATSSIQTQLDAKAPLDSPLFTTQAEIDNEGEFRFREDTANGTNYVSLRANANLGSNVSFVLPTADGSANQVLKTDGSGNLGWSSPLSNPMTTAEDIIVGGASGTPGRLAVGSENQLLKVVSGALAWSSLGIVQIKVGTHSTAASTSSTSAAVTSLNVSITPTSSSNKVLLLFFTNSYAYSGSSITNYYIEHRLYRGSATTDPQIGTARTGITYGSSTTGDTMRMTTSMMVYDSPATTSATTYTIGHLCGSSSATCISFWNNTTGVLVAVEVEE